MAEKTPPKYVCISDAVHIYSLSRSTLKRARASGELESVKRGRSVLLSVEALERWVTGDSAAA